MKDKLENKTCAECPEASVLLKGAALKDFARQVAPWKIVKKHHLEREYKFKNFKEALAFTNQVGKLAEKLNHHPDIFLAWGQVKLTVWTHSAGGLTEGDFILAAKVNRL